MNKTEKINKIKTNAGFSQPGKIRVQLDDKYYKNGGNIQKIYENFRSNLNRKAKIIINFSNSSVFPIFVIFTFKLNTNFPSLQLKSALFFLFFSYSCSYSLTKYSNYGHKLGIRRIESKKCTDFSRKSGKLAIQIKDDYYINRKNAGIEKIFINFP